MNLNIGGPYIHDLEVAKLRKYFMLLVLLISQSICIAFRIVSDAREYKDGHLRCSLSHKNCNQTKKLSKIQRTETMLENSLHKQMLLLHHAYEAMQNCWVILCSIGVGVSLLKSHHSLSEVILK